MTADRPTTWSRVGPGLLLVAAWTTVSLQALAMATAHFQPGLDSDQIYPYLLAANVLDGGYPLSGWTLSSAPYFFPDFTLHTALVALVGRGGQSLSVYVALYYTLLAVACGAWLRAATGRRAGWLAGAVLVGLLLATRDVAAHERFLWWMGSVGFHGGSMLLGLFLSAWVLARTDREWTNGERAALGGLVLLGAGSDMLFLVHWVVPTLVARWWAVRGSETGRAEAWRLTWLVAGAGAVWVAIRVICGAIGFLTFSNVFRYAPWPGAITGAGISLLRDLTHVLMAQGFLLIGGGVVAVIAAVMLARRAGWGRFDTCAVLVLGATTAIPVLSCYWHNDHQARYTLPWLVMPGLWLMATALRAAPARRGIELGATAMAVAAVALGAATAWPRIDPVRWRWPTGDDFSALENYLAQRGLNDGYADYWNVHRFNVVAQTPVRLHPLRPGGSVQFWNDNAFWHFQRGRDGKLHAVTAGFIVLDRLDPAALRARFGAPAETVVVAGHTVWIYDAAGRAQLNRGPQREIFARVEKLLDAGDVARAGGE